MATQSKFERETKKCPAATASHIAVILHDFSAGGSERIAIRLANDGTNDGHDRNNHVHKYDPALCAAGQ